MKKLLFIIPLLLFFTVQIYSQPRENRQRPNFEKLKTELNLTNEQAEKFEALFTEKMEEMKSLRDVFAGDRSAARAKMVEINDKYHKLFTEILTKEQIEKFEEITKERRENRKDQPRRMR